MAILNRNTDYCIQETNEPMNKIFLPLFALFIVSCGDSQPAIETQNMATTKISAKELRDSAAVISFESDTPVELQKAVSLYDQAIVMDPNDKQAHMGKLATISKIGDDQNLLSSLEKVHAQFPQDPFIALHLGMEYELQKTMAEAQPLYSQSLDTFIATLDTMSTSSSLVRNSYLMNMAMANVLVTDKKNNDEIAKVLDVDEMENYQTTKNQIEAMDRNALLNLRRN